MKVCSERNVYGYVFELIIPIVTFFLCIVCTFKFWSDFDIYEKIKVAIGDIYVCFFGWLSIHDFLYKKIEFNISCDEFSFTDKMKNASDNALLKEVLSSSQIAELYTIASDININEYAVNGMIYQQYQKYGQTGDTLYNTILGYLNEDTSNNGWD